MINMSEEANSGEAMKPSNTANYWEQKEIPAGDPIPQTASSNPMLSRIGAVSAWLVGGGVVILIVAISSENMMWSMIGGWAAGVGVSVAFTWMCISAIAHEIRKLKPST